MRTQLVDVVTTDSLQLQGLLYEPDQNSEKLVIHIHGMGGNFYIDTFAQEEAKYFTKNGWALLSGNNRGHDLLSEGVFLTDKTDDIRLIGTYSEKVEDCLLDIAAWVEFAIKKGYTTIYLQGHSLGAVKVVYYLAKTKNPVIKKLILAAPANMVGLSEKWQFHQQIIQEAENLVASGKGDQPVSKRLDDWYLLTAETYLNLGQRDYPADVFNFYDPEKPSLLSEITTPIVAFYGSEDYAPVVSIDQAFQLIKSKAKNCPHFECFTIQNAGHTFVGKEEEVATKLTNYLTS